jgi:virginiamycin B lyase
MSVQEFDIPTRNALMHRIIQGPDGNMWFTELGSDKVGRINRTDLPPAIAARR